MTRSRIKLKTNFWIFFISTALLCILSFLIYSSKLSVRNKYWAWDYRAVIESQMVAHPDNASDDGHLCHEVPNNLLNITDFEFLKSSEVCEHSRPTLVIYVLSAISNVENRNVIRATWGSVKRYKKWKVEVVFLLGIDSNSTIDPYYENSDIVIGNFVDSYHNLSYKHLMGYKWALEHCPSAKYIVKIDDDAFLDIFHFLKIIKFLEKHDTFHYIGNLMVGYAPVRDGIGKSTVTKNEYAGDKYPDYVSGLGYLIRAEAACQILKSQNSRPFFWIDDVFVTGILREQFNFTIKGINSEYYFPGRLSERLLKWYNAINDYRSPPPWTFILDMPNSNIGTNLWAKFGTFWTRTLRAYNLSPGTGLND